MQERERGVIVVGGGPAGSICAAYLAKKGVDVLLIDKNIFPREKPCGDLVGEEITKHIEELKIVHELDEMSTFIKKIIILSNSGRHCTFPFECYSVPRESLDTLLLNTASDWGAEVRQSCQAIDVIKEKGYVKGVKVRYGGCETEIRSKLVIGADGATSQIAKSLGVMREKSSGRGYGMRAYFENISFSESLARGQYDAYGVFSFDEVVKPGYFWVVPVGEDGVSRGYCNVGMVTTDRNAFKGMSLEECYNSWVKKNSLIREMFAGSKQVSPWLGGELTDARQKMEHCGNGFILIGDAAALMMPLRRNGLDPAAASASRAADAALTALTKGNLSGQFLSEAISREFCQDSLRDDILMVESLYDSAVMDSIITKHLK